MIQSRKITGLKTTQNRAKNAAYAAANRAAHAEPVDWLARLIAAANRSYLQDRIALARSHRWAGAIPSWEPVDLMRSANARPLGVIGVDGSQIYPFDHSPVT